MRTSKKGQIAIFVILGILLLAGILLFLNLRTPTKNIVQTDLEPVFYSINACAETSTRIALEKFDIKTTKTSFLTEARKNVSYIVHQGIQIFPTNQEIENSINELIQKEFLSCLQTLKDTFHFSLKKIDGTTKLEDNRISFDSITSINMLSQEANIINREIKTSINTNLKKDMNLLREFSKEQSNDPELFDIGLLSEINFLTGAEYSLIFRENSFFVNFLFYDEEINLERGVWFAIN